jgi:hypothetical protein
MTLKRYKEKSGKSYYKIARELKDHPRQICRVIMHPELVSLEKYLKLALYLDMPEKLAKQEWIDARIVYNNMRLKEKAGL